MKRKTVIITGSTRGIGRGIALRLARDQHNVVLDYARDEQQAHATLDLCQQVNPNILLVKAGVSQKAEVASLMQQCVERFGSIDVLINNAARVADKPLHELTEQDWDLVKKLLSGAWRAAGSVAYRGERTLPRTMDALDRALESAERTHPQTDDIAMETLAALQSLFREDARTPPPFSAARATLRELSIALPPPTRGAPNWAAALILAQRLVAEVGAWSDGLPPALVNQAGQWALPGGGRGNDGRDGVKG